ncbi:MAG: hypothetical protein V8S32_10765 [Lachnospiraceae bacterium]
MMTNILPQEAAARVESDQLTPLRRLPGFTFRESTCAALEKGLQVDPTERYADIPALIKELYPAKRTDLSQISEEAEKAEFREEAHEAESHETEPHKEHSAEAEESNELLKKTAEDELTNKQELKGKIEPSKKADATKNSNNESAASTQAETLLSEQQDISNKPKTLSENAEVETSAKTFSENLPHSSTKRTFPQPLTPERKNPGFRSLPSFDLRNRNRSVSDSVCLYSGTLCFSFQSNLKSGYCSGIRKQH